MLNWLLALMPKLSVATAVMEWLPTAALCQLKAYQLLLALALPKAFVVPPPRKLPPS